MRVLPLDSLNSWQSHGVGRMPETGDNYHIREKDLRKIHKAACTGTDHKCRERLLELHSESLNDRDRTKRLSCKPGMDGSRSTSEDKGFNVDAKEKATKPAIGKKKVKMSALGLGEDDAKSPGDSESFSARRPQKYVDHFSDTADRR